MVFYLLFINKFHLNWKCHIEFNMARIFFPKHNNNNNIFCLRHFAICNCMNDALIISSWYLIDRTLLSWSSKIRKCYKVQGFLPFSLDERTYWANKNAFCSFCVGEIQFSSAFLFAFGCSSNYLSILLSIYSSGNPMLDMGFMCVCVHKANYLCHLWFAITMIFLDFCTDFPLTKNPFDMLYTRTLVIHKRNTQKCTFYHRRVDEKKHRIISLSQPHRCSFLHSRWMYYVHWERHGESALRKEKLRLMWACV